MNVNNYNANLNITRDGSKIHIDNQFGSTVNEDKYEEQ
jgi:hypothetical protein